MVISIDYGTKRAGIAFSDESESIALADKACLFKKESELLDYVDNLVQKHNPREFVVGLPLGLEGKPTKISAKVQEFGKKLEETFNLTVVYWNETMTSIMASKAVRKDKKGSLDSESARIILQEYLDFKKGQ
ncbi:Putative pre-16S rRNA nuclease [Candidatus Brocadiaceae bacterium]|nr:Holliday junction resolvase RuvX [Candidatus Dojkabacteria bacterium]CAG0940767.1 Putative pre-16S rRNA nuclease [Candidatus Brocadiaceae bacterium]